MTQLFSSVISGTLTLNTYLICASAAFVCGIICAIATSFKSEVSKSFIVCIILLPVIVETVITMVNGNVGTGVAVAGAFSLVRFRSVPGKAKDIVCIFLAMTAGLACAAGYVAIAVIFSIIVGIAMIVIMSIPLGTDKLMHLKITVPESLNYAGEFDDLFNQYTKKHYLIQTKTTNMGSLYKLSYKIEMKDCNKMQEFIDKLRCRNGNLEISIAKQSEESGEL